ncbi:hypothetical protein LV92_04021 [Arenibacter echinorum]|uniref:Uncharacterized protein n=1 Tax=Arenibacter echinorum TaxID=440515 RepID=A0A327QRB5_9FLAO|nr:hypothetical protein LV92_04021 [Arenibacter echinorum]
MKCFLYSLSVKINYINPYIQTRVVNKWLGVYVGFTGLKTLVGLFMTDIPKIGRN